jgi:hypothetical protein
MIEEDSSNRLAILGRTVYIIQPSRAKGKLIYRPWPDCNTHFTGNAESGLLASIERIARDAIPELKIYQLPGGTIYDQFPRDGIGLQGKIDKSVPVSPDPMTQVIPPFSLLV